MRSEVMWLLLAYQTIPLACILSIRLIHQIKAQVWSRSPRWTVMADIRISTFFLTITVHIIHGSPCPYPEEGTIFKSCYRLSYCPRMFYCATFLPIFSKLFVWVSLCLMGFKWGSSCSRVLSNCQPHFLSSVLPFALVFGLLATKVYYLLNEEPNTGYLHRGTYFISPIMSATANRSFIHLWVSGILLMNISFFYPPPQKTIFADVISWSSFQPSVINLEVSREKIFMAVL